MIGLDRRTFLFLLAYRPYSRSPKEKRAFSGRKISELEVTAAPTILPLLED
jgi:hypothetical protein